MSKEENTYYKDRPSFWEKGSIQIKTAIQPRNDIFPGDRCMYSSLFCNAACDSNFRYGIKDTVYPEAGAVWMRNRISVESDRENGRCISGAGSGKHMKKEKAKTVSRCAGVILALVVLITIVTTLINMLIPELITSIRNLIFTLPAQINQLVKQMNHIQLDDSTMTTMLKNAMNEASTSLQNWMRTDLLNKVNEVMTHLTVGLYTLVMELFHAVIGVIVSVYILFGKETFINQSKKATYAIFPTERANLLIHIAVKTNEIFGGFIIGKIIDSIIIGILCFIGTSLLNMPYAMLVSVIVGMTNVIPFFGPYIGAIPSAVLIALADPMKGVYFLIFILLLQQFDGNILGPKILGNSTGLSAFWVIVSILLGGGLFGILGMLFGVPAFAVIYYIVKLFLDNQLEKKKLPTESECYNGDSYVDNDGTYFQKKDNMTENEEQKTEENKKEKEE